MTGCAGASTDENEEAADLSDIVSGKVMDPAGYIGTTPTGLIGRAHDMDRLAAVLADPDARLVTVTGPAGVGKSRLVMEFFRRHWAGSGDAVEVFDFVQMADVAACRAQMRQCRKQCVEDSLEVQEAFEHLRSREHAVVLDHYEDVADELVPLLAEFRRCCPQIRIVSIGTTRLGLYGERVVRLQPLATGDMATPEPAVVARIPAVELFVECARSVRPEFTLTAENTRAVLELCRLAGGLPFAMELAASQVSLAEPELILERFERGFADVRRNHHPYSQHSSISDLVSWVFAHLTADERMLLTQLAIFEGPFTARAAAGLMDRLDGGIYPSMEGLIDKSVLIPRQRPDGELSLSMPSVVRLAAARSLAGSPGYPALRRAHGEYFRTVAEGRARPGPDVRADLLAAFDYWREAGDAPALAAIANALRELCAGAEQARQCLRLTDEVLRAGVEDPRLCARVLEAAGDLATRLGSATARDRLDRARDAYDAVHDQDGAMRCLGLLGDQAYAAGDLDRARRRFEEGLAALDAAGRDAGTGDRTATTLHFTRRLAVVLREAGDLSGAREVARSALAAELYREDSGGAVLARYVLATIVWLERDSAEARALFADAAEQVGRLEDVVERPECLELLAIGVWKWGRITDWHLLTAALGLADRLRQRLGPVRPRPLKEMVMPVLAAASQQLTAEEYDGAWRAGAELPWEAALRLVRGGEPAPDDEATGQEPAAAQEATAPGEATAEDAGPDVPADVADVLTKRELEVALLVAEGLTNRVIARKLGIAEWTVVNHLRKVMRKLGCQSRVHVTRRLAKR